MNKDCTVNNKSVFSTLGSSNHTTKTREEHDYYATDPNAIDFLIDGGGQLAKMSGK